VKVEVHAVCVRECVWDFGQSGEGRGKGGGRCGDIIEWGIEA